MVEISGAAGYHLNKAFILKIVSRLKKELKFKKKLELSLVFVSPEVIKKINKRYRSLAKATDVLSFAFENNNQLLDGEIIICLDELKRNAGIRKQTLNQELKRVLTHGFLHLLGYDHQKEKDYRLMSGKESKILKVI